MPKIGRRRRAPGTGPIKQELRKDRGGERRSRGREWRRPAYLTRGVRNSPGAPCSARSMRHDITRTRARGGPLRDDFDRAVHLFVAVAAEDIAMEAERTGLVGYKPY